jgi:hypothetical protein
MFTKLVHYRLDISVDGHRLPRERLARHLGRDGARIVRLANGHGIGEVNVEVLTRALPDLAAFVCRLSPAARQTRLRLETVRIEGGSVAEHKVLAVCEESHPKEARRRRAGDERPTPANQQKMAQRSPPLLAARQSLSHHAITSS